MKVKLVIQSQVGSGERQSEKSILSTGVSAIFLGVPTSMERVLAFLERLGDRSHR